MGLARDRSAREDGGLMKRTTLVALAGLAVAIVPLALWWCRMERDAAA